MRIIEFGAWSDWRGWSGGRRGQDRRGRKRHWGTTAVEGEDTDLELAATVFLWVACAWLKAASGDLLRSVFDLRPARALGLCFHACQRQVAVVAKLCAVLGGEVLCLSNKRSEGSD